MPHRVGENTNRVRIAHQTHVDPKMNATEVAFRAIADGTYRGGGDWDRARTRDRRPEWQRAERPVKVAVSQSNTDLDAEHARIQRDRIGHLALAVACDHADAGQWCWPTSRGLCGDRVTAGRKTKGTS